MGLSKRITKVNDNTLNFLRYLKAKSMIRLRFIKMRFCIFNILSILILFSCNSSNTQGKVIEAKTENTRKSSDAKKVKISQELIDLESKYTEILTPISTLKTTHSKTYWFIVSWLNTAYRTPDWTGYYSDEWMKIAKQRGIDCSGFSRVMLDQIYDKKVSGSSQGLLNHYCTPIGMSSLEMGDLVFFKAPYAKGKRIVHVGVYLLDTYFVHATSKKSAAIGLGLSINSLNEKNWAEEFVSGGKVKD